METTYMEERNYLPSLYIGSSSEGIEVAEYLQQALEGHCESTLSGQDVFGLGQSPLESLALACKRSDFAAFILTPGDMVTKEDNLKETPRDNVLFEIGFFMGGLGRYRTFIVYCQIDELNLPSHLRGVRQVTFKKREDGNMSAAISTVARTIRTAIEKMRNNENVQTSIQNMLREFVMYLNISIELKDAHHLLQELATPLDLLVDEFKLFPAWQEKPLNSDTTKSIWPRWGAVLRKFSRIERFVLTIKFSEARSLFYPLIQLKNDFEASLKHSNPVGLYELILLLQLEYQKALDFIDEMMLEQFEQT